MSFHRVASRITESEVKEQRSLVSLLSNLHIDEIDKNKSDGLIAVSKTLMRSSSKLAPFGGFEAKMPLKDGTHSSLS